MDPKVHEVLQAPVFRSQASEMFGNVEGSMVGGADGLHLQELLDHLEARDAQTDAALTELRQMVFETHEVLRDAETQLVRARECGADAMTLNMLEMDVQTARNNADMAFEMLDNARP